MAQRLTDRETARLLGDARSLRNLVFLVVGDRVYHNDGDGWYLLDEKETTIDGS